MARTPQELAVAVLNRGVRIGSRGSIRLELTSQRLAQRGKRKIVPAASSGLTSGTIAEREIIWFHPIDLGGGRITPGHKTPQQLADEVTSLNVPADLTGLSVLDIGAWDG